MEKSQVNDFLFYLELTLELTRKLLSYLIEIPLALLSAWRKRFPYNLIHILDFSNWPLSRVLHVTLANWQGFGFEFHLGSSPSAFSRFVNVSKPAAYFTACYTVLKRPNKVEIAFHGCNLAFSLDSIVSLPR